MAEMREYINTNEMKEMAERLSRSLSWCHNMLRSQEKMTSESAFRELTKLLYIKYITEIIPEEREEMKSFLKGAGQIYPDQRFEHLFDEVKKVFDKECLFDHADHILATPATCDEIIDALSFFDFTYACPAIDRTYEEFSQKVMRGIDNTITIPSQISEFIIDVLKIKPNNKVIDPFCGYGALLSAVATQLPMGHKGELRGFADDRLMAQTANMNLLMCGNKGASISFGSADINSSRQKYDFVISYLNHSKSDNYINDRDNLIKTLNLAVQGGMVALITPDDFLQGDRFCKLRSELVEMSMVMGMVLLPANAIRIGGKPLKSSILILKAGYPHPYDRDVMMAKVEDLGISAIGLPSDKNDFKKLEPVMMSWLHDGRQKSNENAFFMRIAYLDSWNIQAEFAKEDYCLFSKYPRYRLADLVRVIDSKLVDYPKDVYNLVTVRKNKRDIVFREKITAKQLQEKNKRFTTIGTGQLVISRIGAKDGAIGIVPKNLDGSIVSDNFLVLEIVSSEIDSFYLLMVLTSERYKNMLRVISRGITDRSYIRTRDLLGLTIPMPGIEEQRKIVGDLQEIQQRISKLETKWADGINRFSKELFEQ